MNIDENDTMALMTACDGESICKTVEIVKMSFLTEIGGILSY